MSIKVYCTKCHYEQEFGDEGPVKPSGLVLTKDLPVKCPKCGEDTEVRGIAHWLRYMSPD